MHFSAATTVVLLASLASATSNVERSCAGVELIHASGTTESGLGVVGQPLSTALAKSVTGLSTYSLPYNTDADYTSTVTAGATLMQQRIASTLSACPETKFVLSGYSKGAMVVHHTAKVLTAAQKTAVHGVAVFGDPDTSPKGIAALEGLSNTWPLNDGAVNVNVYAACVSGDEFCDGGGITGLAAHLTYASNGDVGKAASFLAGLVA
ncbi:hypothetical protein RQP46_004269 [Phenoliferia psychrophenolica]